MATMKEVINYPGAVVKIIESPIPEPSAFQVLIKVVVSGCNPKDWKVPDFAAAYDGPDGTVLARTKKTPTNQGDDIAGIVEKVGPGVVEFKVRTPLPDHPVLRLRVMLTPVSLETVLRRSMKWAAQGVHMRNSRLHGTIPHFIYRRRHPLKVGLLSKRPCSNGSN